MTNLNKSSPIAILEEWRIPKYIIPHDSLIINKSLEKNQFVIDFFFWDSITYMIRHAGIWMR